MENKTVTCTFALARQAINLVCYYCLDFQFILRDSDKRQQNAWCTGAYRRVHMEIQSSLWSRKPLTLFSNKELNQHLVAVGFSFCK